MSSPGRVSSPFGLARPIVAAALVAAAMFALTARLYYLQVVRGAEFTDKSESNFVQLRRVVHDRGIILDRNGRILVDNRPAYDVYLTPAFLPDSGRTLASLVDALELDRDLARRLDRALQGAQGRGDGRSLEVAGGVRRHAIDAMLKMVDREHLLGVDVQPDSSCHDCSRVLIQPLEFPSAGLVFQRLASALGVTEEELAPVREEARGAHGLDRFLPIRVSRDLPWEAFVRVDTAVSLFELPGVDVQHTQRRRYRTGLQTAHLLGYINEMTPAEYQRLREDGYKMGDFIGRSGIERTYERELRGIDGFERVVVDAKGRRMGEDRGRALLGDDRGEPPQPGHTLVLSVDADLQRVAEESFAALQGVAGAVVAVEVKTGFVLAMASYPSFDPNLVSGRISAEEKHALDTDRLQPWVNRAIAQQYPPGSTFKVVTALAGMQTGVLTLTRRIHCNGSFRLGSNVWRCWRLSGHGALDLHQAIKHSCDVFFYTVGWDVGIDALASAARLLGYDALTGIDLDNEVPGLIGDTKYYLRRPEGVQKGYAVNNAIGQGDIAVTPLQQAMAYATIANGGTLYAPQLVREVRDQEGQVVHRFEAVARWRLQAPEGALEALRSGLQAVCEQGGTAYGLHWRREPPGMAEWVRTSGVELAGKTGTAQVVKMGKEIKKLHELDYWERDHAWFVAYAPASDPEIAVAVVNEHSGHGGSHAAPIAANVIRAYFELVRPRATSGLFDYHPPQAIACAEPGALP
ncbi:MAG: penicillin-binding protein 2 [Deltaproteobacteria bacterium]|nr:penicillin-binding protein 2 [Deltaproteobacteria bacterium]